MIRISRLDLIRWGRFTTRSLTFGDEKGLLQLVYGDNEAGKSTTRRGASAMLFGIPERTQDAHTHSYPDLRLGALLQTDQGPVELVRRKGNINTLLDLNEEPLENDPIAAALRGLTPEVYSGLFEISHQSLVEGGRQLLEGRGSVGEALFAAAAGTGRLHQLLNALDAEATKIFKPSGRTTPLNVALARYAASVKELNAATVRPSQAAELRRAVEHAGDSVHDLDEKITELERESGRLRRWKAVRPMLMRHSELRSELQALDDPPALDAHATERRVKAQRERDEGERELHAANNAIVDIQARRDAMPDPGAALELADAIDGVHSEIAAIRKAALDRPKREGELATEEARINELLPRIDSQLTADTLDRFASDQRTRRALVRCLNARGEISERLRNARQTLHTAKDELNNAKHNFDRSKAPADTVLLQAALSGALKLGPIEEQAVGYDTAASDSHLAAADHLKRIESHLSSREELEHLTLPATEAVEDLLAVADDLASQRKALELEQKRIQDAIAQIAARRAAVDAYGPAPSAETLASARRLRTSEWEGVLDALRKPVTDTEHRVERFERAIENADHVADDRTSQADKLAQLAEIESTQARLATENDTLAHRSKDLQDERQDAENSWRELWKRAGIRAPAPAGARAWLENANAAQRLLQAARAARGNAEATRSVIAQHSGALTERLTKAHATTPAEATLDELIVIAESTLQQLRASEASHAKTKADVERAEQTANRAQTIHDAAEQEKTDWDLQWQKLRDAYGMSADISPDDASEVLQDIDAALIARRAIADLRRRIDGIDRDRQIFSDEIARIAAIASPDMAGIDPEQAATKLMQTLTEARRTRKVIDALEERLKDEKQKSQAARSRRDVGGVEIEALMAKAAVSEESQLVEVERRAARAAELQRDLPNLELEIAHIGEDTFEALAAETSTRTVDELDAAISTLDRELTDLRRDRDAAKQALFETSEKFKEADNSDTASLTAAKVQQELAYAQRLAERYAIAKLSTRILRDTIERYRATHQGPMMNRANELFPLLTHDAYTGLFIDWSDAGEPVIVGRAADDRHVHVHQMSDGTREQLFLALRIAAIERYVASASPVPVLFDDVFLESDDDRTEQIVLALADLAHHTQVIVFTHHHHLIQIAQNAVDPDRLRIHDLNDQDSVLTLSARAQDEDQPCTQAAPQDELRALAEAELDPNHHNHHLAA